MFKKKRQKWIITNHYLFFQVEILDNFIKDIKKIIVEFTKDEIIKYNVNYYIKTI